MEVKVKIRFNASKNSLENYDRNRYLLYLPFPEDQDSEQIIAEILSKKVGTPKNRILLRGKDVMGNWIFELT